jgi:hypothetical protein
MIPKIIHYCWFGGNPLPKLAHKCLKSWKKFCPDYEIREWNEQTFSISEAPLYVRQAYEAKKWAFVTDYIRLHVIYTYGGIYFDTDVELLRNIDCLLVHDSFFGYENAHYVSTGLGFGAKPKALVLKDLMKDYEEIPFVLDDGSYDLTPCPFRNQHVFDSLGAIANSNDIQYLPGVTLFPARFFSPKNYVSGDCVISEDAFSIHHFLASWQSEKERKAHLEEIKQQRLIRYRIRIRSFVRSTCLNVFGKNLTAIGIHIFRIIRSFFTRSSN